MTLLILSIITLLHNDHFDNFAYLKSLTGGPFFVKSTTDEALIGKYKNSEMTNNKIKVLIMPGHEPGSGGTQFGKLVERDIAVDLSLEIMNQFLLDNKFEAILARDKESWNIEIQNYFDNHKDEIQKWRDEHRDEMNRLISLGLVNKVVEMEHNSLPNNSALRLYGVIKWANDNDIDFIIHVHFNDHPRKNLNRAGKYEGFAIYIPEDQYSNSAVSRKIGQAIFKRLSQISPPSDLPLENGGLVPDQEFIAVGRFNTADPASILIEYGYIYEKQLVTRETRALIFKEYALATYLGLKDYFEGVNKVTKDFALKGYKWKNIFDTKNNNAQDVLAPQLFLLRENYFPPPQKNLRDCPVTGFFGPCTKIALSNFQADNRINSTGFVDEMTLNLLNK